MEKPQALTFRYNPPKFLWYVLRTFRTHTIQVAGSKRQEWAQRYGTVLFSSRSKVLCEYWRLKFLALKMEAMFKNDITRLQYSARRIDVELERLVERGR